jgi:hypothetical protein
MLAILFGGWPIGGTKSLFCPVTGFLGEAFIKNECPFQEEFRLFSTHLKRHSWCLIFPVNADQTEVFFEDHITLVVFVFFLHRAWPTMRKSTRRKVTFQSDVLPKEPVCWS